MKDWFLVYISKFNSYYNKKILIHNVTSRLDRTLPLGRLSEMIQLEISNSLLNYFLYSLWIPVTNDCHLSSIDMSMLYHWFLQVFYNPWFHLNWSTFLSSFIIFQGMLYPFQLQLSTFAFISHTKFSSNFHPCISHFLHFVF